VRKKRIRVIASTLWLFTPFALAETNFITDSISVDLHSGPGAQYRIVSTLKTGAAVNVFETSSDQQWRRISAEAGKEGWVRNQYLTAELLAQAKLDQALEHIKATEGGAAGSNSATLIEENAKLTQTNKKLMEELVQIKEISADAIKTDATNKELHKQNQMLNVEAEQLRADNERLKHENFNEGIKWGALAVLLGVVVTLIIPRFTHRRRNSAWIE
jgi:SH3 domain protein